MYSMLKQFWDTKIFIYLLRNLLYGWGQMCKKFIFLNWNSKFKWHVDINIWSYKNRLSASRYNLNYLENNSKVNYHYLYNLYFITTLNCWLHCLIKIENLLWKLLQYTKCNLCTMLVSLHNPTAVVLLHIVNIVTRRHNFYYFD